MRFAGLKLYGTVCALASDVVTAVPDADIALAQRCVCTAALSLVLHLGKPIVLTVPLPYPRLVQLPLTGHCEASPPLTRAVRRVNWLHN